MTAVDPPRGPESGPTEIAIAGEGFEAGARVSLIGGGPFLAGSHMLPEGARAVEVTGKHACVTFYSHTSKLGGTQILDITHPAAPVLVGSFEPRHRRQPGRRGDPQRRSAARLDGRRLPLSSGR